MSKDSACELTCRNQRLKCQGSLLPLLSFFSAPRMKNQIGHSTGHVSRQRNLGQKMTPQAGPQKMSLVLLFWRQGFP